MKSIDNYRNGICRAYITFIFTVLPLFFVNMYFNIAQEKWLIFMISTIIFLFVMAVALLLSFSANDKKGKKSASFFYGWGLPEYAVIAFLLANIISLLASRDTNESLLGAATGTMAQELRQLSDMMKYGSIVISTLPIMMLYPFLQKYFNQGVMIGAVKG